MSGHAPDQGVCAVCGQPVFLKDGVYVAMKTKSPTCKEKS